MKEKDILNVYPLGGRTFARREKAKTPDINFITFWDNQDRAVTVYFYEYQIKNGKILKDENGLPLLIPNKESVANETGFTYKVDPLTITGGLLQLDYSILKDRIKMAQFISTPLCNGTKSVLSEIEMIEMVEKCSDFSEYQDYVNKHGTPVRPYPAQFHVVDSREVYKVEQRHMNIYHQVQEFGVLYPSYTNALKGIYYLLYNFVSTGYDMKVIDSKLELQKQITKLVFNEANSGQIHNLITTPIQEISKKVKWHILSNQILKNKGGDFYYMPPNGREEYVGTDMVSILSALPNYKSLEKELNEKLALYFGDFDEFCETFKTIVAGVGTEQQAEKPKQTRAKKDSVAAELIQA